MKLGLNAAISNFSAWQVQLLYLLYAALIVAFSVAHYRLVEKPLYRRFRRNLGSE
jgi:peptidoglycan/LPS O-acetylase OafA/YrhL